MMGAEGLKAEQRESEIPITHRKATRRDLPAEWLDGLLVASCEIQPESTLAQAAGILVGAATELLPDAAIGVRAPSGVVVRRSPRGEEHVDPRDPTRLFPDLLHERVVPIPGDDGSTLHLASDDESRFAGTGVTEALIDRLTLLLAAAIRNARVFERARRQRAELQQLEEQVIQTSKLASLGQMAAGIMHELNNPLTSIVAYSDYLYKKAERTGVDHADVERLGRINEAAERILRFSRDLMAYSRPSPAVPAAVAIHAVIDRALVFCDHVLEATHVQVERDFGDVPLVRGINAQLTQVFVNLFTNAAHAMAATHGGRLTIKTELTPTEDAVSITIRDEGHGIEAAHLDKIFEPFFTTKPDGTGAGLGLSIVRNIMTSHGGKIRAYAHASKGTVFYLELPVAAAGER
ncbi:sensor histidine kinase [Polyangium aurulentum]|uniref:sensor histidine kinase n=1 Tax=Polyangium aurulentum TaxID=2567896 RepID=UPI0010AE1E55|nr:ATP-binding protein [Polyangium aurulentum]UQA62282.1 GHKL domain-containing protein [Polyangium aurulentum]